MRSLLERNAELLAPPLRNGGVALPTSMVPVTIVITDAARLAEQCAHLLRWRGGELEKAADAEPALACRACGSSCACDGRSPLGVSAARRLRQHRRYVAAVIGHAGSAACRGYGGGGSGCALRSSSRSIFISAAAFRSARLPVYCPLAGPAPR